MIGRHPKLRFQCFLASRHANQSMCTLARELPNLSLAGYWWHNFFPDAIAQVMRERLEMLPANKQVGFFSDAYCAEWSYAKAVIVRKILARVLAERIELGQLDLPGGARFARAILYDSPQIAAGDAPAAPEVEARWPAMETARIAQILDEMGTLLEIKGENPFRCRAYHTAAQSLVQLAGDLSEMIADGSLKEVPGIGETMYAKIVQLATTGQLPSYDELRRSTPPGLVALLAHARAWARRRSRCCTTSSRSRAWPTCARRASRARSPSSRGSARRPRPRSSRGSLSSRSRASGSCRATALRLVAPILEAVRAIRDVIRAEVCGSLRRRAETIGDLDILFSSKHAPAVLDAFVKLPQVATVLAHGPTKASVRLADGVQCDLRGVEDAQFPFALHYFTGSKAHNIAMRQAGDRARALA